MKHVSFNIVHEQTTRPRTPFTAIASIPATICFVVGVCWRALALRPNACRGSFVPPGLSLVRILQAARAHSSRVPRALTQPSMSIVVLGRGGETRGSPMTAAVAAVAAPPDIVALAITSATITPITMAITANSIGIRDVISHPSIIAASVDGDVALRSHVVSEPASPLLGPSVRLLSRARAPTLLRWVAVAVRSHLLLGDAPPTTAVKRGGGRRGEIRVSMSAFVAPVILHLVSDVAVNADAVTVTLVHFPVAGTGLAAAELIGGIRGAAAAAAHAAGD